MPTTCPRCGHPLLPEELGCRHCGLLISTTSEPPSVWPTFLVTTVLGLFGLIPASRATREAQRQGTPTNTYWRTFGLGVLANVLVIVIVVALWLMGLPGVVGFGHGNSNQGQAAAAGDGGQPTFHSPASTTPSASTVTKPAATQATGAQTTAPAGQATVVVTTTAPATTAVTTTTTATATATQTQDPTAVGSQWPAYEYRGPASLCSNPVFPDPSIDHPGEGPTEAIASVQAGLVALGYGPLPSSGVLDPTTVAALKRYQARHELVTDGTLGQQSWSSIAERLHTYGKC